jgi:hypothetical protein
MLLLLQAAAQHLPPINITIQQPKTWVDLATAISPNATSVTALAISLWVAITQNRLKRREIKKDQFDRRFVVYIAAGQYLTFVLSRAGVGVIHGEEMVRFDEARERAEMLFGPEVRTYLADIRDIAGKLYVYATETTRQADPERIANNEAAWGRFHKLLAQKNDVFRKDMYLGDF